MEQRPKLELQLNIPTKLKLLKAKPYEGSNGFGPYYLYTVEHDGIEKAFFAPPEIHEQIAANKLNVNSEFVLTKTAVQNGKKITPTVSFQVLSNVAPEPIKANGGDGLAEVMEQSLNEAVTLTQRVNTIPWQNEDVRSIALTMFIQRARSH